MNIDHGAKVAITRACAPAPPVTVVGEPSPRAGPAVATRRHLPVIYTHPPALTTSRGTRLAAHADTKPSAPADPAGGASPAAEPPSTGPRIFLHIGEPKTGTTSLQQIMWRSRSELAARGVVLPGHHPQDHFRASQDLRGIAKLASDPAGSWAGEWEILARQAQQAPKVAVISHELFSAADAEQAGRAVRSLLPGEVHVVLTVRDMATLLPAEWQETLKPRNNRGFHDWLQDAIDRESRSGDRRHWSGL